MRTWPSRVKRLRKKCVYTQEQLGAILCVTSHQVANWEQGRSVPGAYLEAVLERMEEIVDQGDKALTRMSALPIILRLGSHKNRSSHLRDLLHILFQAQ